MDRNEALKGTQAADLYSQFREMHDLLDAQFMQQFKRSLPLAEEVVDRWERARKLGFGEGTNIYDSAFVFGSPKVGKNCWIGPYTIIDGSGGLEIGDNCTISTGVHIYTHDNVKETLSGGKLPIEREKVTIGSCSYIGPQSIITKGVNIGSHCLIASNSFVNRSVPDRSIVAGNPAKVIGKVEMVGTEITFNYDVK